MRGAVSENKSLVQTCKNMKEKTKRNGKATGKCELLDTLADGDVKKLRTADRA